jgi:hypothetical protein
MPIRTITAGSIEIADGIAEIGTEETRRVETMVTEEVGNVVIIGAEEVDL